MRAALYARISLDRREGAGVGRQVADCRALAAERGLVVEGEYVDNDLTAYRAKRRPEWERLLSDVRDGTVQVVVAYHPDRLYRRLADLEEFADVVKAAGAEVLTVKAGDLDLSTASGRMVAGILGSVARGESERMGERVSRAKQQLAQQGLPPGGGLRPFGYETDKVTLHPVEAPLVRDAAERVAAGESMWTIAVEWNTAGVTTTAGNPWEVSAVRRVLTSPRIAGLRAYKGQVVGDAVWPAIIDRGTRDLIVGFARSRRRGRPGAPSWLLSRLIACPHCGRPLYGSQRGQHRAYACSPGPGTGRGCGGAVVSAGPCEAKVVAFVDDLIEANLDDLATDPEPVDDTRVQAVEARKRELARRWGAMEITDDEYDAARAALAAQVDALAAPVPSVTPTRLARLWRDGTTEERRIVIASAVACPMPLSPERMANPADRLTVQRV